MLYPPADAPVLVLNRDGVAKNRLLGVKNDGINLKECAFLRLCVSGC